MFQLSPHSTPDDGLLWLLLIRSGVTRQDLYRFLSSSPPSSGSLPEAIQILPVRGLRIAPLDVRRAPLVVDGEALGEEEECLQAFVMPGVARTYVYGRVERMNIA